MKGKEGKISNGEGKREKTNVYFIRKMSFRGKMSCFHLLNCKIYFFLVRKSNRVLNELKTAANGFVIK